MCLAQIFLFKLYFVWKTLPVMKIPFLNQIAEKSKLGLKGLCVSLGKHNDALYAVLAIAVFKGIFRPTFTMMDKSEKPEVKRYAAFREGLTEGIAFVSYFITSKLLKKVAKPLCNAVKRPEALGQIEHSISFLAVCLSAGVVIPAVCNLTLKPIMDLYKGFQKKRNCGLEKHEDANEEKKLDVKENVVQKPVISQPVKNIYTSVPASGGSLITLMQNRMADRNAGMKVGC